MLISMTDPFYILHDVKCTTTRKIVRRQFRTRTLESHDSLYLVNTKPDRRSLFKIICKEHVYSNTTITHLATFQCLVGLILMIIGNSYNCYYYARMSRIKCEHSSLCKRPRHRLSK